MKPPYTIKGEVKGEGVVVVCAWCHPGETIFSLFPDLRGHTLSHGICEDHRKALLKGLVVTGKTDPIILPQERD